MIENSIYEFRYFTCAGQYLFNFDAIESIDFGRAKNEIGMAELIIPAIYDINFFDKDYVLEIWRYNQAKNRTELVGNTCWFLRKIELYMEKIGYEKIKLTFYDTISLLQRRTVAWFEIKRGTGVDEFIGDYPSGFIEYPDIVVDRIFYHNFTAAGIVDPITDPSPGAPFTANNLHEMVGAPRPGFPISMSNPTFTPRDTTLSNTETYTFAQQNCLEAMRSIVDSFETLYNREMWFDIVYTPSTNSTIVGNLQFNVWLDYPGQDHTFPTGNPPILFGPEFQNITDASLELDFENEATQVIAINGSVDNTVVGATNLLDGTTVPSAAGYAERVNADRCRFYPIEAIVSNNTNEENTNFQTAAPKIGSILTKARSELNRLRPKHTLSGDLINSDGAWLFINYQYGDLVSVNWKRLLFNASIKKIMITYDSKGETVTVPFESSVTTQFLP